MKPNPQFAANLITFPEKILNGKLHFCVQWMQSSKNRLKLIQYFKDKIVSTRALLIEVTQSSSKVEQKWKEDFKCHVFFSHGKTNSCGVLTVY